MAYNHSSVVRICNYHHLRHFHRVHTTQWTMRCTHRLVEWACTVAPACIQTQCTVLTPATEWTRTPVTEWIDLAAPECMAVRMACVIQWIQRLDSSNWRKKVRGQHSKVSNHWWWRSVILPQCWTPHFLHWPARFVQYLVSQPTLDSYVEFLLSFGKRLHWYAVSLGFTKSMHTIFLRFFCYIFPFLVRFHFLREKKCSSFPDYFTCWASVKWIRQQFASMRYFQLLQAVMLR